MTKKKPKKKVELNKNPPQKMSDEDVKKLARELVTNQVFMSDQLRRPNDLPMVFMVLALAEQKIIDDYLKAGVVHFYEYFNKAIPGRGINGYPIFVSCFGINSTDYKRVQAEELRMREALK